MNDDALIEAMARAMFKDDQMCRLDIAKAMLAIARPIIEAPLHAENERLQKRLDASEGYIYDKQLWKDYIRAITAIREMGDD